MLSDEQPAAARQMPTGRLAADRAASLPKRPAVFIDINRLGDLAECGLTFEEQRRALRSSWNRGNDPGLSADDLQHDSDEERNRRRMDRNEHL